ncbi:MAG: hypothetical protein SNH55_01650 [Rikenellaceae bacterium]
MVGALLIVVGSMFIAVALIAIAVIYFRSFRLKRDYSVKRLMYADEYILKRERLVGKVPYYGLLILLGVIIIVLSGTM